MISVARCFLTVLVVLVPHAVRAAQEPPAILPLPQEYAWQEGALRLTSLHSIVLGRETTDGDRFAAGLIRDELRLLGIDVTIDYEGPETSADGAIHIGSLESGHADGYRLTISPRGGRIEGRSERGRFYGALSMVQLIRAADRDVRAVHVVDYPELPLRGILDEVDVETPTLEHLRRTIRFLGEHKMNVYAVPVERLFQFEHRMLSERHDGTITRDEWAELQDVAESYHVDLVPVFRTLGHSTPGHSTPGHSTPDHSTPDHLEDVLDFPRADGTAPRPGPAPVDPRSEASYALLEELLDEVVSVFRSPYFHIGGDLSPAPHGEARAVRAEEAAGGHLHHYRRVYDMVRSRGKTVLMDADVLVSYGPPPEALLRSLPSDLLLVDDQYAAAGAFPSAELYGRTAPGLVVGPAVRRWGRIFPDHQGAWRNLASSIRKGHDGGARGVLARGWTALGAPQLPETRFRTYAYAAEWAWNADTASRDDADRRFNQQFYGADLPELRGLDSLVTRLTADLYHPVVWNHPLHEAARGDESLDYAPRPTAGWPASGPETHKSEAPTAARAEAGAADLALTSIEALQARLSRRADHLDYRAYAARLAAWRADTRRLASWMARLRHTPGSAQRTYYLEAGAAWADRLASEARSLAQAFRLLWLRSNREVHLDRVTLLFDYQVAFLEEMAEALRAGRFDVETEAPSAYIAAPSSGASYLRATFILARGRVEDAFLQVASRAGVEVWLNGDEIGRLAASDRTDVRVWNVAPQLRSGVNVLAASVQGGGSAASDTLASANIYLEVRYEDGRVRRIASGKEWKASGAPEFRWFHDAFSDAEWANAVVVGNGPRLTAPMFHRGLPSRVETGEPAPPR